MQRGYVFQVISEIVTIAKQYYVVVQGNALYKVTLYVSESGWETVHNSYGPARYDWDKKRNLLFIRYYDNGYIQRAHGPADITIDHDKIVKAYNCWRGIYDITPCSVTSIGYKYTRK